MPLQKGDVHVDGLLSSLAGGYTNSMLVWDFVMPRLNVAKDSDKFGVYGPECFRTGGESSLWNDGGDWNVLDYTIAHKTYSCTQHAYAGVVTQSELRNQDRPFDAFRDKAAFLQERLMLDLEAEVATKCTTAANFKNSVTLGGTSQWTDAASTPITDIITGCEAIRQEIGRYPNRMLMGAATWSKVAQHDDIVSITRNTVNSIGKTSAFAQYFAEFGITDFRVAGAIQNTAVEGATATNADVWGDSCLLFWQPPSPGIGVPAFGYTFSSIPAQVERTVLAGKRATLLNNVSNWDPQFVVRDGNEDTIAGYLIADTNA